MRDEEMELILITNDPELASYAEEAGIDDIMVDLEVLGKESRQSGLNTVISNHTFGDIAQLRAVLKKSKLLVRVNPIHEKSGNEIDETIKRGADILMLPMFTMVEEVRSFIEMVGSRALVYLLLETPQALVRIDDILELEGIDGLHIGLNDLHLAMGLDFMFELLSGGIIEYLARKISGRNIKFGFGGISRLGKGLLNSRLILSEHCRLKSRIVILSRDFKCYRGRFKEIKKQMDLKQEINKLRGHLRYLKKLPTKNLRENAVLLKKEIHSLRRGCSKLCVSSDVGLSSLTNC